MKSIQIIKQRLGLVQIGSALGAIFGLILSFWIARLADAEYNQKVFEEGDES